jgi:hypothetical protein
MGGTERGEKKDEEDDELEGHDPPGQETPAAEGRWPDNEVLVH